MRRIAFLAAASIALIAISEPPSAEARGKGYDKCTRGCDDKIAKKIKYCRDWAFGDLPPADQRSWKKCIEKCKKDFPCDRGSQRGDGHDHEHDPGRDPCRGGFCRSIIKDL